MNNNNPSSDPAYNGTLVGAIQFALKKAMQNIDGMLPAKVIAYDQINDPNFVQVQPLIAMVGTSGQRVSRPQLARIPLYTLGSGSGFFINFDLKPGDFGWIEANDRDISLFLQNYEEAAPNTQIVKSFSSAVFKPDCMRGFSIAPADAGGMVISNLTGTVKIVLQGDTIKIVAPTISATATQTTLAGNLLVNGNIVATGSITPGG